MNESLKAIEAIIKKAIEGKHSIVFRYKNNTLLTKVEPYLIGELSKADGTYNEGKIGIRAYYLQGYTSQKISSKMNRWRIYHLENIKNLRIVNEIFHSNKKDYHYDDKRFKVIFKQRI